MKAWIAMKQFEKICHSFKLLFNKEFLKKGLCYVAIQINCDRGGVESRWAIQLIPMWIPNHGEQQMEINGLAVVVISLCVRYCKQ